MKKDKRDIDDARVVREIRKAGFRIRSVYDFVNTNKSYAKAIPVLLRMLPVIDEPVIKSSIVRALTVREARGVAERPLLREFYEADNSEFDLKWVIGNALKLLAGDELYKEITSIVTDKIHGTSRRELVSWLGKMRSKQPQVTMLLIKLLNDDDVVAHALEALRRLRAVQARTAIEPLLTHPRPLVRREAAKTLKVFDSVE